MLGLELQRIALNASHYPEAGPLMVTLAPPAYVCYYTPFYRPYTALDEPVPPLQLFWGYFWGIFGVFLSDFKRVFFRLNFPLKIEEENRLKKWCMNMVKRY